MERTYIDINVPNLITITLINMIGAVAVGFAMKLYRQSKAGG